MKNIKQSLKKNININRNADEKIASPSARKIAVEKNINLNDIKEVERMD